MPHQVVVARVSTALARVAPAEYEVLAGANILRRTRTDRLLIPDVLVVNAAAARQAGASVGPEDVYLAVEVISPPSRETDLYLKQRLYSEWGIGSYWVLDPGSRELREFGLRERPDGWPSARST